jgi:hypothetical protein
LSSAGESEIGLLRELPGEMAHEEQQSLDVKERNPVVACPVISCNAEPDVAGPRARE